MGGAGAHGRLPGQLDGVDHRPPGHQPQPCHPREELEIHATLLERQVQGCEHDLTHSGSHPPHERAFVVDHHQQRLKALSGGKAGTPLVSPAVCERQVVQTAQHRRLCEALLARAVAAEPFPKILSVQGPETPPQDVVANDARQRRRNELQHAAPETQPVRGRPCPESGAQVAHMAEKLVGQPFGGRRPHRWAWATRDRLAPRTRAGRVVGTEDHRRLHRSSSAAIRSSVETAPAALRSSALQRTRRDRAGDAELGPEAGREQTGGSG